MLDSSLGKILSAKQIEKSADIENSSKARLSPTSEKVEESAISSEAEVRLVVRFIVEEHIVYNGKVQRVQQLESEELSRVVSRVAWDVAKESDRLDSNKDDNVAHEDPNFETLQEEHEQHLPTTQSTTTTTTSNANMETNASNTTSTTTTIITTDASYTNPRSPVDVTNEPAEEPHSEQIEKTTIKVNISHPTCDGSEDFKTSSHKMPTNSANSPAQTEDLHSHFSPQGTNKSTQNCDTNLEQPSNHTPETDQLLDLIQNQEIDKQESTEKTEAIFIESTDECQAIQSDSKLNETKQDLEQLLTFNAVDNQSIIDTLSECVKNVDIEFQQHVEESLASPLKKQSDENDDEDVEKTIKKNEAQVQSLLDSDLKHNVSHMTDKIDVEELLKSSTNEDKHDLQPETDNSEKSQKVDIDHLEVDRLITKTANVNSTNKKEGSLSNKRRASNSRDSTSPSNKKMRKGKDQKNSITKKSMTKSLENSSANKSYLTQPSSDTMTTTPNMSLLANNTTTNTNYQPMRHNKAFAKWSDNHYYPGTILRPTKDRKYVIGFFDGAQRNVAESDLIPLCNIKGRQVRVSIAKNYCVNALVHDQRSPINDQPMFDVEYQQDGLVQRCVPLKDIFLTGEQGNLLINQVDKNSGASNFADVDLDNIIYEKRSRRLQEMEDFELTENTSVNNKRKRGQYNMRNITPKSKAMNNSPTITSPSSTGTTSPALVQKRNSQNDINQEPTSNAGSPDVLKANFLCPNSNPPSESSSSTGSSNVPNVLELGQEFYFASSSPHRTKTSLLL